MRYNVPIWSRPGTSEEAETLQKKITSWICILSTNNVSLNKYIQVYLLNIIVAFYRGCVHWLSTLFLIFCSVFLQVSGSRGLSPGQISPWTLPIYRSFAKWKHAGRATWYRIPGPRKLYFLYVCIGFVVFYLFILCLGLLILSLGFQI